MPSKATSERRLPRRSQDLRPRLVAWRRYLHAHPELSFHETETAAYITSQLEQMDLAPRRILPNAVVLDIGDPARGPTIALRADIDALPIQEATGLPFASERPGVMHACGHDGHTAILLGVAALLGDADLPGCVRLIFQPAEEIPPGGAQELIAAGVLDGVSAITGLHLWSPLPRGTAAAIPGPAMAAADRFTATIRGSGGHGAMPHLCVDALEIACRAITALQTIVSRGVNPLEAAVVTVGMLRAGEAFNIVAGEAALEGTVRTFSPDVRQTVREQLHRLLLHTAAASGAEVDFTYIDGYPAVVNDPGVTELMASVAGEALGPDAVRSGPPEMAAEDFARYLEQVPGCFLLLGTGNAECGATYPHHHPRFTVDEDVLPVGAAILAEMAWRLLAAH